MKQVSFDENDLKRFLRLDTKAQKIGRIVQRTTKQLAFLAIIFFVCFFVLNYSAYAKRLNYSIQTKPVARVVPPVATPAPIVLPDYPPSIEIPKIGITAPLAINVDPANIIEQLKTAVAQYQNSATPGQIGNMVVVGHSSDYPWSTGQYKNIFALIDKLQPGDQIIVPYKTEKYLYEVTSTKIVKPTDLSVLKKTDTPTLTLLTCYPVGTTRSRYIVLATLKNGAVTGTQETDPLLNAQLPTVR